MIIFRYLTREVYATLLGTTTILLLIFISNQLIHYLGQAASGGLPARAVMQLMSLQVPLLLGFLLPLGLFLGILLAYGRLYVDNEMMVLAVCGVSRAQLLGITMLFSAVITVVVAFLMLWLEPKLAWYRDRVFAEAAVASPIETIFPGRFQAVGDGKWVAYIGSLSRDRMEMNDVFVARLPEQASTKIEPWTIISAANGHQWVDPKTGDQFIVLNQGYRYTGNPGQKNFQIVQYDQYGVRVQMGKLKMGQQTEFMPTSALWSQRNSNPQAAAEMQWRLTMPVATLILALMAVPLSQVKPRKGRYAKLLPAILIYIVYADLIFVMQAAVQKSQMPPFPGMWWVHGFMLLVALILLAFYIGWGTLKRSIVSMLRPKL